MLKFEYGIPYFYPFIFIEFGMVNTDNIAKYFL